MNDTFGVGAFLEHHGVKGQRWGVRKANRQDQRFFYKGLLNYDNIYNHASVKANADLELINNKPQYKGLNLNTASAKVRDQYYKEVKDSLVSRMNESAETLFGQSKTGKKLSFKWINDPQSTNVLGAEGPAIFLKADEVFHDDMNDPGILRFDVEYDSNGHIISINFDLNKNIPDDVAVMNAANNFEEFLDHHGIKGQKWGVRKKSTPGQPSEDAARANEHAVRVKTQGLHTLSNKDLQDYITRLNLEQQYTRLAKPAPQAATKFVSDLLRNTGKQHINNIAAKGLSTAVAVGLGMWGISTKR